MAPLRVVFLGNDAWSVPPLEALAASAHEVALVATRVPRPAGRGSKLTPTPVAEAARARGLPLAEVETVKSGSGLERLREVRPDVLLVVAYGEILPAEVLLVPSIHPVNLHFSLLPALRGPAPVQRAFLEGLTETGVTTMVMDDGVDTGPVLLQAAEPIREEDDAGSLGLRLAQLGGDLLVQTLDRLEAGSLVPQAQDDAKASRALKLFPEDRVLDWGRDAGSLVRLVRALAPEPGATTSFHGQPLKVLKARAEAGSRSPGIVVDAGKAGFRVATGSGLLRPLEVQPAGRRRMSAAEFVRGFRPEAGERLG